MPESFNTNISHQLFDYKFFLNPQPENTNSKGNFVPVLNVRFNLAFLSPKHILELTFFSLFQVEYIITSSGVGKVRSVQSGC